MKARVAWVDGKMFVGESGSGHAVVMDGAGIRWAQHGHSPHGNAADRHGRVQLL